jgi:hypothetical protein
MQKYWHFSDQHKLYSATSHFIISKGYSDRNDLTGSVIDAFIV